MYRSVFLIVLMVLLFTNSYSQKDSSARAGRHSQIPAMGRIAGKLIDETSHERIEYASVAVIDQRTKELAAGTLTDENGRFLVESLAPGIYLIEISSIGFETDSIRNVSISPEQWEVDLKVIKLNPGTELLKEATIKATKSPVSYKLDKKVVNIKDIDGLESMQTTDILQNVPSIDVDIDGNVSLRGSGNVRILIDGKPVPSIGEPGSVLNNIPTSAIESIEVITNPSAKYDPDGVGGIINIILKKDRSDGFNVNVSGGVTTSPGANLGVNANFKKGKTNFFLTAGSNADERWRKGKTQSDYIENGSGLFQDKNSISRSMSNSLKFGMDHYLNKYNTITFSASGYQRIRTEDDNIDYRNTLPLSDNYFSRNGFEDQNQYSVDLNAMFKHEFGRPTKNLVFDINYNFNERFESVDISQDSTDRQFNYISQTAKQYTEETNNGSLFTAAVDFVNEYNNSKIEFGGKSIIRQQDNDYELSDLDRGEQVFVKNLNISNRMLYHEQVHGIYGIYGQKKGKLDWQVGVRGEYASIISELVADDSIFKNPYYSWFPTIHTAYDLGKKRTIKLNYSKRINRPHSRQLNPFTEYTDPYHLRRGNPFLQPEYIHSAELGYTQFVKRSIINAELYYRYTKNGINRFINVSDSNVTTVTYANFGHEIASGAEVSYTLKIGARWNINASGNIYRVIIDGDVENTQLSNDAVNWSLRGNATYKINTKWSSQLFGFYSGPRVLAQGEILPMYSLDLSVKRSFAKEKGSVGLRLSDVFNTRMFRIKTSSEVFAQESDFKWQSRVLSLNVNYRFGNIKDEPKRRGRGGNGGGGDEEDMGM